MTVCEEASADVENEVMQEIILETENEDLVANNTLIPELLIQTNAKKNVEKVKGHFKPIYLAVEEEKSSQNSDTDLSEHERQLLLEYKTREAMADLNESKKKPGGSSDQGQGDGFYEEMAPRHGDVGFHKFLSVIQKNPGHILR